MSDQTPPQVPEGIQFGRKIEVNQLTGKVESTSKVIINTNTILEIPDLENCIPAALLGSAHSVAGTVPTEHYRGFAAQLRTDSGTPRGYLPMHEGFAPLLEARVPAIQATYSEDTQQIIKTIDAGGLVVAATNQHAVIITGYGYQGEGDNKKLYFISSDPNNTETTDVKSNVRPDKSFSYERVGDDRKIEIVCPAFHITKKDLRDRELGRRNPGQVSSDPRAPTPQTKRIEFGISEDERRRQKAEDELDRTVHARDVQHMAVLNHNQEKIINASDISRPDLQEQLWIREQKLKQLMADRSLSFEPKEIESEIEIDGEKEIVEFPSVYKTENGQRTLIKNQVSHPKKKII